MHVRTSGINHPYMSTCMQRSVCDVWTKAVDDQNSEVHNVNHSLYPHVHTSAPKQCQRPCIHIQGYMQLHVSLHVTKDHAYCVASTNMVHASVWHTCQCTVYVLSTFTKLCDQKAQWVSTIASTDMYMRVRISTCVSAFNVCVASTTSVYGYVCKHWKPWVNILYG